LNGKDQLGFVHESIYTESTKDKNQLTLLLLHKTGGDENNLIPIARILGIINVLLLSPRGNVLVMECLFPDGSRIF
jgi:phospholipase/carboxylesterase